MHRVVLGFLALAVVCFSTSSAFGNDDYRLLQMDGRDVKWGAPALGTGASVTYAIVTRSTTASGINNCRAISSVDGLLAQSNLTRRSFEKELKAAFRLWRTAANVRFKPVKDLSTADILISAESQPDGVAYSDVTPAPSTDRTVASITRGIICLNPTLLWTAKSTTTRRSLRNVIGGKPYRLRYVLAHEIGHVLGLDHPSPTGELMSFEYNNNLNDLQPGDIAGIVALYGPSLHPAGTSAVARNAQGYPNVSTLFFVPHSNKLSAKSTAALVSANTR